jgi:hypothetical protein
MASGNLEDLVCAVVKSGLHDVVRLLKFHVATIYKNPVNPVTNQNMALVTST